MAWFDYEHRIDTIIQRADQVRSQRAVRSSVSPQFDINRQRAEDFLNRGRGINVAQPTLSPDRLLASPTLRRDAAQTVPFRPYANPAMRLLGPGAYNSLNLQATNQAAAQRYQQLQANQVLQTGQQRIRAGERQVPFATGGRRVTMPAAQLNARNIPQIIPQALNAVANLPISPLGATGLYRSPTVGQTATEVNRRLFEPTEFVGGRLVEENPLIRAPIETVRRAARGDVGGAVTAPLTGVAENVLPFGRQAVQSAGVTPVTRGRRGTALLEDAQRAVEGVTRSGTEREEFERALGEIGLPERVIGGIIADPLNLAPVVGFTKADDFVRVARAIRNPRVRNAVRTLGRYVDDAAQAAPEGVRATVEPFGLRQADEVVGARPSPEGVMLKDHIPERSVLESRLRKADEEIAAARDEVRALRGRRGVNAARQRLHDAEVNRAKIEAQLEIDEITNSGRPIDDQFNELQTRLQDIEDEQMALFNENTYAEGLRWRGSGPQAPQFGDPARKFREGPSAENMRLVNAERRRVREELRATGPMTDAKREVYKKFLDDARFEPVREISGEEFSAAFREPVEAATEAGVRGVEPEAPLRNVVDEATDVARGADEIVQIGDSLAPAQTGRPLRGTFYRGDSDMSVLDDFKGRFRTPSPRTASGFAVAPGARVARDDLTFRNPLVFDSRGQAADAIGGINRASTVDVFDKKVANWASNEGYDAVIYRETNELQDLTMVPPSQRDPLVGTGPRQASAAFREPIEAATEARVRGVEPLRNVVDEAERAVEAGEPLPSLGGFDQPPREPPADFGGPPPPLGPKGRETPFVRPSQLKSVDEITQDIRRSTQTFIAGVTERASHLPPVRTMVDLINPSALVEAPPQSLVDEIGEEGARNLQATLTAHARKMEQGNAVTAAIEDGVRQGARRVGLEAEDGVVRNSLGLDAPIGDVFENPKRYARQLTREQRDFIDDVQAVLDDINFAEKRAGVAKGEVFSGEGRYFPRQVVEVRGQENLRSQVRRIVGAKQGFQRERFYQTMQEGIEAGVDYGGDIASLVGTRIRAGMKAISDTEMAELVRPLGRTLKAPKTSAGLGELGTLTPAFGGRVFPHETAIKIMDALNPRPPASVVGALDQVNNLVRPVVANGDLSATFIQLLPTAFRNPSAFAKALLYEMDAVLMDGRLYGRYIEANADWIERFVSANGIWNGSEFSFEQAARSKVMSKVLQKGLGRFSNAFNNALNVAALENFKGMVGVGDSLGDKAFRRTAQAVFGNVTGQTSDEIAASVAGKMTGRLNTAGLGIKAQQRATESAIAFAPKYYRALFGLLGDAVQGGMRGAEARRVLAGLTAGAVVTHVGIAKALGQEPNLDPTKSQFLTVKLGGTRVGIGGPVYGLVRTAAEMAENPDKIDQLTMENALVRWFRGRSSPLVGVAADLLSQRTFLGEPLTSAEDIMEHLGKSVLPFTAQSAIDEGPESAVPQALGLRSYPESLFERRNDLAQERFGKDYGDLDIPERQELEGTPEFQRISEQIEEQQRERGSDYQKLEDELTELNAEPQARLDEISQRWESGDLTDPKAVANAIDEVRDIRQDMATRRETLFRDTEFPERDDLSQPVFAAVDDYFSVELERDPVTFDPLWDKFFEERDKAFAGLSADERKAAKDYIEKNLTTFEKDARDARETLNDAPPKYEGLNSAATERVEEFSREVSEAYQEVLDYAEEQFVRKGEYVPVPSQTTIALFLAEQRGDEALAEWYKLINRGRAPINESWSTYVKAKRPELNPFYPWLYDSAADRRRLGLLPLEPETGRVERAKRAERPRRLTRDEFLERQQELAVLEEVLSK